MQEIEVPFCVEHLQGQAVNKHNSKPINEALKPNRTGAIGEKHMRAKRGPVRTCFTT